MLVTLVGGDDHRIHLGDHLLGAPHHMGNSRGGGNLGGVVGVIGPDMRDAGIGDAEALGRLLGQIRRDRGEGALGGLQRRPKPV